MTIKRFMVVFAAMAVGLPLAASAQTYDVSTLEGIVVAVSGIINTVFPVLIAIGVFMIVWSIFSFILNAGDPEARTNGMKRVFWSVIGVVLMMSVWGLINLVRNSIEFDTTPITPPVLLENI